MNKLFYRQQKGAVTIEFAFMLLLLCLLIAFMADLFIARSTIGKLDRTSYSLLNVVKERAYSEPQDGKIEDLAGQQEITKLTKLANKLVYGDAKDTRVQVVVEAIKFPDIKVSQPAVDKRELPPGIKTKELASSTEALKKCKTTTPKLEDIALSVTPFSEFNRFVTLYRVTVCIPQGGSMFLTLSSFFDSSVSGEAKSGAIYRSSSIGIVRGSSYQPNSK